jgi:hypothetical protein
MIYSGRLFGVRLSANRRAVSSPRTNTSFRPRECTLRNRDHRHTRFGAAGECSFAALCNAQGYQQHGNRSVYSQPQTRAADNFDTECELARESSSPIELTRPSRTSTNSSTQIRILMTMRRKRPRYRFCWWCSRQLHGNVFHATMRAVGAAADGAQDVFVHRDCAYLMFREGGWEEVNPDQVPPASSSSRSMEDPGTHSGRPA